MSKLTLEVVKRVCAYFRFQNSIYCVLWRNFYLRSFGPNSSQENKTEESENVLVYFFPPILWSDGERLCIRTCFFFGFLRNSDAIWMQFVATFGESTINSKILRNLKIIWFKKHVLRITCSGYLRLFALCNQKEGLMTRILGNMPERR